PSSTGENGDSAPAEGEFSVYDVLARSGLLALGEEPLLDGVRLALEHLGALTRRASDLERALVREGAIRELKDAGIQAAALIVDAAMMTDRQSGDAKGAVIRDCAPSAVYHSVELYRPTLVIDEADTFLPGNEELRGVLDSGHFRPTAMSVRSRPGGDSDVRMFNTFSPVAVALIGNLSGPLGTVED